MAVNVVESVVSQAALSSQSQRTWSAPFEDVEVDASNATGAFTSGDDGVKVKRATGFPGGGGGGGGEAAGAGNRR